MSMFEKPLVRVGIKSSRIISFELLDEFFLKEASKVYSGIHSCSILDGHISFDGKLYTTLTFSSNDPKATFRIFDVTIGINFHWQQLEDQIFEGGLTVISEGEKITAINVVDVESYLKSVISSEMRATSSIELLKSHAIISRSWVISQIESKASKYFIPKPSANGEEHIVWYDHSSHSNFDVCADDHCQRYQGITKETSANVARAVEETTGEVLTYGGKICDARFSKSCGGVSEKYSSCWEDEDYPYLTGVKDSADETVDLDLTVEENARKWILETTSDTFCNTNDAAVLKQVLNNYDQATTDFFRWKVEYTQDKLKSLVNSKSGFDFGDIISLQAEERGVSGRIVRLRVKGTKCEKIIGKELEIRRILSETHLYSSAFIVSPFYRQGETIPHKFLIQGAGWGHGVGLCQIGAAVMAHNGYSHEQILAHYYKYAVISKNYNR